MYIRTLSVVLATTLFLCHTQTATAQLPADRTVYLYMYETPGDPETDIVFGVELDLSAADSDGDWIGWEATSAYFLQPGASSREWTDTAPFVDTADGLWWIEHLDPADPQHDEFTLPPALDGIAAAHDPLEDDLEYNLEGVSYTPPPGGPPFDATGAVDYTFTLEGQQEPEQQGNDEPVEVPHGGRDPD